MDLRKSLFILPNLFTLASLFCGLYAITLCIEATDPMETGRATVLIIFAMLFDGFDGRVARLTKTQSSFGLQMDSIVDVVSFGVAPAVIFYRWSLADAGMWGLVTCFVYLSCGAIRLSRFNVINSKGPSLKPKTPGKYITGLPIPTAAGFLVAFIIAANAIGSAINEAVHLIMGIMLGLGALMVSTIKFRSFKNFRLNPFNVGVIVIGVAVSLLLWLRFKQPALILIYLVGLYIVIGLAESLISLGKRARDAGKGSRENSGGDDS